MKKSIFLAALALLGGMALTSCNENTEPRLEAASDPEEFKLYEPAENNYTYDLTNPDNTIILTTSGQPNYGVAVLTSYEVQVSLTGEWKEGVMGDDGEYSVWPTYYTLPTVNTQSVITATAQQLNLAITSLQGIHEEEDLDNYSSDPCPLYVRVRAYVAYPPAEAGYLDYTEVFSNAIKINSVQPAYEPSLPLPASLWVIGDYQGWNINGGAGTITLTEEEYGIGSNIYTGYLPATAFNGSSSYFRFYSALGDWETNSYGFQVEDNGTAVKMVEESGMWVYNGKCVAGKGSWLIENYPGDGWCKLLVDLNAMKVSFQYDPTYSPE